MIIMTIVRDNCRKTEDSHSHTMHTPQHTHTYACTLQHSDSSLDDGLSCLQMALKKNTKNRSCRLVTALKHKQTDGRQKSTN